MCRPLQVVRVQHLPALSLPLLHRKRLIRLSMGNKLSRRQEAPANSSETAATEQKAAEEPVTTQQAEASVISQSQEAVDAEKPAAVVETVVAAALEAVEESVPEIKAESEPETPAASAPLNDVEPECVAKEAPAQPEPEPEPLVSTSEPIPAPEPVVEPETVPAPEVVIEPATGPIPEAEPTPDPEPVAEPVPEPVAEPVPEPVAEAVPEPVVEPEPASAEAPEQETDHLAQESLPEVGLSSVPLVDLGVPDVTSQSINTPPSPAHIPDPDEQPDIPGDGECPAGAVNDSIEAAVNSTSVPEKSDETLESLEKPVEPEHQGAGYLEQLVCDVNNVVNDSGLLNHVDLTGNDLVSDLIPKIPDDIPIADISASSDLM